MLSVILSGHRRQPLDSRASGVWRLLLILSAAFICLSKPLCAQHFGWVQQFGTSESDWTLAVTADTSGACVAGYTWGTFAGEESAGIVDAYVRKHDPQGAVAWTRQFGTSDWDEALAVSVTGSGIFVAGATIGALPNETNAGDWDAFLRKYDHDGNDIWTRQFGTAEADYAWAVFATPDGIFVAGSTAGALPGQTNLGSGDAFLQKYDDGGVLLWTRQFGSDANEVATAVSADSFAVYIAGVTSGTFPSETSAGARDAFLAKYALDGDPAWTRQFGSGGWDEALSVSAAGSAVYVGGWTQDTIPGQTSAGGWDAVLWNIRSDGITAWARQFGSSEDDAAVSVYYASSLAVVQVAGWTLGTLPGEESAGDYDAFLRTYDPQGGVARTTQFGTSSEDYGSAVYGVDDAVYVAGDTWGAFAGGVIAGEQDGFLQKYTATAPPPSLEVDLFSDQDGDFIHGPGEERATTSTGGTVRFLANAVSLVDTAIPVTLHLDGLPAGWAPDRPPFVLLAGGERREILTIRVPESPGAQGSYPLTLRATTDGGSVTATGHLEVLGGPIVYDLLPPDRIVTGQDTVSVSCRTSSETTARVTLIDTETGEERVGESLEFGSQHAIEFNDLDVGSLYEWLVSATDRTDATTVAPEDPRDPGVPIPRQFLVGVGVVFTERSYELTLERDYNQVVELGVRNRTDATRDVVLRIENPYPDVAIGFIGTGSVEEPALLRAGEERPVALGVHLQDADPTRGEDYHFTAEVRSTRGSSSVVVDSVPVTVRVEPLDIRFHVTQTGGLEPGTLAANLRVTNDGSTLTDLSVEAGEDLAGRVQLHPAFSNARLATGESIDFQAIPVSVPEEGLSGEILVKGAGVTETVRVTFEEPVLEELFTYELTDVTYCTSAADRGCTNRRRISVRLELPAGIPRDAILGATLSLQIAPQDPRRGSPHNLDIHLNGHAVGALRRTRPDGVYVFDVPPEILNVSPTQVSSNTVVLSVSGLSGGNYYIASLTTLCVCLSRFECRVWAPSAEEAQARCDNLPGLQPRGGDVQAALELLQNAIERNEVTLRVNASRDGTPAADLLLEARFSSGEPSVTLSPAGEGIYEGVWRPACAGMIQIEIHARGCEGGVVDSLSVEVQSGPPVLLPVPTYSAGNTAWGWAAATSGVLAYHGLRLKPWTVAAAVGADPSEALDLRDAGAEEPSLATLLAYLRDELGLPLSVVRYGSAGAGNVPCELRSVIRDGHPLLLLFGSQATGETEALVATGASATSLWVSAPGAVSQELAWDTFLALAVPDADALLVTVEVLSAPLAPRSLSLNLLPGVAGEDSSGLRVTHSPAEALRFLWDGRWPLGFVFGDSSNDPPAPETWVSSPQVFIPDPITGTAPLLEDVLDLAFEVRNAGPEPLEAAVKLTIEHTRSKRRLELSGAPEEIPSDASGDVVLFDGEALDIPLDPNGHYVLSAVLLSGGDDVDSLAVPFRVRCVAGVEFIRGDVGRTFFNDPLRSEPADRVPDLSDAVAALSYLFLDNEQSSLDCEKAADSNDDGVVDLSDPIRLLQHLYVGEPPPPAPYPGQGLDETPDDLDCCRYPGGGP